MSMATPVQMDYKTFRRHIGKANLTIGAFAKMIDVQPNAVSNHAKRNEVPRTYAVLSVCLGELADMGVDLNSLLKKHKIIMLEDKKNCYEEVKQIDLFSGEQKI